MNKEDKNFPTKDPKNVIPLNCTTPATSLKNNKGASKEILTDNAASIKEQADQNEK